MPHPPSTASPIPLPEVPSIVPPRAARVPLPKTLSPWAWTTAVILGQPNAHRLVRAFFLGLIGLATVLLGAVRGCR